jgi:hypothetical protein
MTRHHVSVEPFSFGSKDTAYNCTSFYLNCPRQHASLRFLDQIHSPKGKQRRLGALLPCRLQACMLRCSPSKYS